MQLTHFSVRTGMSSGLRCALAITQLRLQSQVSKPLDRNSRVPWVDLHAVADAAELFAGDERGAGAAEGIVGGLASAANCWRPYGPPVPPAWSSGGGR